MSHRSVPCVVFFKLLVRDISFWTLKLQLYSSKYLLLFGCFCLVSDLRPNSTSGFRLKVKLKSPFRSNIKKKILHPARIQQGK